MFENIQSSKFGIQRVCVGFGVDFVHSAKTFPKFETFKDFLHNKVLTCSKGQHFLGCRVKSWAKSQEKEEKEEW